MRNLTEGPILKTMVLFSLPVLGGNALQSLNSSVNAFWVSHTLGENAVTATANANIIMMFLLGSVFGISMAANLMVAQAVGADDERLVKRVMGSSIIFFIVLAGLLAIFGGVFTPQILDLMGTPGEAKADAIAYLRVIFLAMPFLYFFAFIQMAQRGVGDSRTPFYFMVLAVFLDILFNPLLIRGIWIFPNMGIAGSAAATLISQAVSLTALIVYLYRRNSILVLKGHDLRLLRPDPELMSILITKGLPMGFQMLVISSASMVMMGLVNGYGVVTAAAYGAATQVWTYIQMPAMALSAAVSTMAGQNVGARRWDRVDQVAVTGVLIGLATTGACAVAIYALGDLALRIFLPSGSAAIPVAHHINMIVLWAFVLFSITFSLFGVVRATGAVAAPLIILTISMWVIRIPFAKFLEPWLGADAIWWSFPLGTVVSSALAVGYYRFGGWRKNRLMGGDAGQAADTGLAPPAEPADMHL